MYKQNNYPPAVQKHTHRFSLFWGVGYVCGILQATRWDFGGTWLFFHLFCCDLPKFYADKEELLPLTDLSLLHYKQQERPPATQKLMLHQSSEDGPIPIQWQQNSLLKHLPCDLEKKNKNELQTRHKNTLKDCT